MVLGLRRRKLGLPYVRGVELHWVATGVRSESEPNSQLGLAEFARIEEDEAGGLAEVGPVRPMREHVPAQEGLGVYAAVPDHLVRGAGDARVHGRMPEASRWRLGPIPWSRTGRSTDRQQGSTCPTTGRLTWPLALGHAGGVTDLGDQLT